MATAADVARLRRLTNEPTSDTYTDMVLMTYVDDVDTVEQAAYNIWLEKAASYAVMVDVTEGSSSRKLSQLRDSAIKMAGMYAPTAETIAEQSNRPYSRAITRPKS